VHINIIDFLLIFSKILLPYSSYWACQKLFSVYFNIFNNSFR